MRRFLITFTLEEYAEVVRRADMSHYSPPNFLRALCVFPPLDSRNRQGKTEKERKRVSVYFNDAEETELKKRIAALDPKLNLKIDEVGNYLRYLCGFAPIYAGRPIIDP
jgi:hypothetical protein